jgi:tetratricopeptide (TPR) repeat protein
MKVIKFFPIMLIFVIFLASCITLKTKENVAIDYFNMGNNYFDNKDYAKAASCFEKSIDYNNNFNDAIVNLVISYQKNKDYDKVQQNIIKYFKKVDPKSKKKLQMALGNNFFLSENYEKALSIYNDYKESYPDDANSYFNIGLTYLKLNDEKKALSFFLQSYEKDSKFIPAIYNIASYYYNNKNYKDSYNYFSILEDLDKNNPDIYYKLGLIEYDKEEYQASKKHLSKAIEIKTDIADYYVALAKVYAKGYNDKIKTIENLELAFKNNFKDLVLLQSIKEFKLLYEFKDYKDLLKKYDIK